MRAEALARKDCATAAGCAEDWLHGATEDIFDGLDSRRARPACPAWLWPVARRKLTQLNRVRDLQELSVPPGRLERLRGDRAGQHSIRINDQYRVCFQWENGHAGEVEITDHHA